MPLGVVPPAALDDKFEHYPLAPGDRLLLLSDGVVASRNANDELFGEQRLLAVLDANDDPARLFDELEQALLDLHGQQHDALSLVAVVVSPGAHTMPSTAPAPAHPSRPLDG